MHNVLRRALAAYAAGLAACLVVGLAAGLRAPAGPRLEQGWRLAGILAVPGVAVGAAAAVVAALCTPSLVGFVRDGVRRHPGGVGAALLVVPPAAVFWLALVTHAGQRIAGLHRNVGLAAMFQGVAYLALTAAVAAPAVAVGGLVARRLPRHLPRLSRVSIPTRRALRKPLVAGALVAAAMFAFGVLAGDEQGRGALVFGSFGVLRKPELDLVPVAMLGAAVAGTLALWFPLRRAPHAAALGATALAAALLVGVALRFGHSPAGARIDARPGPVQRFLEVLRDRTDRDGDGHSAYFGGADCDDRDRRRHPDAQEVPGNGLDEDCSGRDGRARPGGAPEPSPAALLAAVPADLNVLVITVDTLRADALGARCGRPAAPNLARLARESVVFERAYALSSNTMHAVGPLFAGRYPTECARDAAHFTRYLPENVLLAERLRAAGFRTLGVASHFYFDPRYGLTQGIDHWDTSARVEGEGAEWRVNDDRVADRVVAALARPEMASGRFFLWAHFFDPHHPYAPHPGVPACGDGDRAGYDREVAFTDAQVGRVLAALDASPAGRRTAVVVTADHGEAFGEHGTRWHGVELWEELVRVPLLVRVPGIAPRRVGVARSAVDLVPTLLDLARVPRPAPGAPDALSGRSLVADLVGLAAAPRPVYIELPPDSYNRLRRAVVDDGWKLVERGSGRYELYDLGADPDERADLAARRPDRLALLLATRETLRAQLRVVPPSRGYDPSVTRLALDLRHDERQELGRGLERLR